MRIGLYLRFGKRALDLAGAALLLVALAPLIGAVALATRIALGPGVIFRQTRLGLGAQPFTALKFRSMRDGAGSDAERLTRYGAWLRRTSLDELPGLVNVLRGEMSLVGPRAWPIPMVRDQVARGLDYRNRVVAGWTGPAQVEKGAVETSAYAELDLAYVEACRAARSRDLLRLDLRILAETVKVLVRGEGLRF